MAETAQRGDLMETADAAIYLGKQPRTLEDWRSNGKGPKYLPGKPVRYRKGDLDAWLDGQAIEPASRMGIRKGATAAGGAV